MMVLKRGVWFFALLMISLGLTACGRKGIIPIIGVDHEGKVFEMLLPEKDYTDEFGKALNYANEKTLIMLNHHIPKTKWELGRVDLGLGLQMEGGLGPFQLGVTPYFVLRFEKR